jgi:hypothetical protein
LLAKERSRRLRRKRSIEAITTGIETIQMTSEGTSEDEETMMKEVTEVADQSIGDAAQIHIPDHYHLSDDERVLISLVDDLHHQRSEDGLEGAEIGTMTDEEGIHLLRLQDRHLRIVEEGHLTEGGSI